MRAGETPILREESSLCRPSPNNRGNQRGSWNSVRRPMTVSSGPAEMWQPTLENPAAQMVDRVSFALPVQRRKPLCRSTCELLSNRVLLVKRATALVEQRTTDLHPAAVTCRSKDYPPKRGRPSVVLDRRPGRLRSSGRFAELSPNPKPKPAVALVTAPPRSKPGRSLAPGPGGRFAAFASSGSRRFSSRGLGSS